MDWIVNRILSPFVYPRSDKKIIKMIEENRRHFTNIEYLAILKACCECNRHRIMLFIFSVKKDLNLEFIFNDGTTLLTTACIKKDGNNCIKVLLDNGADVNTKDMSGYTPLMLVLAHGSTRKVDSLLTKDVMLTLHDIQFMKKFSHESYNVFVGWSRFVKLIVDQGLESHIDNEWPLFVIGILERMLKEDDETIRSMTMI